MQDEFDDDGLGLPDDDLGGSELSDLDAGDVDLDADADLDAAVDVVDEPAAEDAPVPAAAPVKKPAAAKPAAKKPAARAAAPASPDAITSAAIVFPVPGGPAKSTVMPPSFHARAVPQP